MSHAPDTPAPAGPLDYAAWSRLLSAVVTADGKVDYEALAARRGLLDEVVALLASASPDTAPERFPSEEHALAYWINAYNAFVLHAVMEEYPIRSVWKVKDGHFFDRRRHDAGGRVVSLDDIEHRILRARFAEPRIHFAINCASNGCPPMRPRAYEADGLRDTLDAATRQFLASEWNCRVDAGARRIFVSRIFRMYAEDFAGDVDSTRGVPPRRARLRGRAHGDCRSTQLADYEVVYNVYDWGLNDAHRAPQPRGPSPFTRASSASTRRDAALRELYLYDGNFCNRACSWCTVFGSPEGWHQAYTDAVLDAAAAAVAPDGNIKFYGGEPTLHAEGLLEAMRHLRSAASAGSSRSTRTACGRARSSACSTATPGREAVLNYSIYLGRDAEPLPERARHTLEALGARASLAALHGLQGAVSRGRRRRPAARSRPRGGLPRAVVVSPLLPRPPLDGRLPRLPLRRREPRAPLPPRRPLHAARRAPRELPPLPRVGAGDPRPRRAGARPDELRDVPAPRGGAPHLSRPAARRMLKKAHLLRWRPRPPA